MVLAASGLRVRRTVTSVDRKSTRLNSSHSQISYAVFCLKKKKKTKTQSSASCLMLLALSTTLSTLVLSNGTQNELVLPHHTVIAYTAADFDKTTTVHKIK